MSEKDKAELCDCGAKPEHTVGWCEAVKKMQGWVGGKPLGGQ